MSSREVVGGFADVCTDEKKKSHQTQLAAESWRDTDVNVVAFYLKDISRFPLLTAEEEKQLSFFVHRYSSNRVSAKHFSWNTKTDEEVFILMDATPALPVRENQILHKILASRGEQYSTDYHFTQKEAKEIAVRVFVESNLGLVIRFAVRVHQKVGANLADVIQTGNLGLIRAVEKFDGTRGNRFSTYAMYWIKQRIRRTFYSRSLIYFQLDKRPQVVSVRRIEAELLQRLGHQPSDLEISEAIVRNFVPPEKFQESEKGWLEKVKADILDRIEQLRESNQEVVSLDADRSDEQDEGEYTWLNSFEDTSEMSPEQQVLERLVREEAARKIGMVVDKLDPRDKFIFESRNGLNGREKLKLKEIAQQVGISAERVRQRENEIRKKLFASEVGRELMKMFAQE